MIFPPNLSQVFQRQSLDHPQQFDYALQLNQSYMQHHEEVDLLKEQLDKLRKDYKLVQSQQDEDRDEFL